MEFKHFRDAVEAQFNKMAKGGKMYVTGVSKDSTWDKYMESFPAGTNEIFRERREYDCQTCRQFIRHIGNAVTINKGKLVSVWDVEVEGYYQEVVDSLSAYVKGAEIADIFLHNERTAGKARTVTLLEDESTEVWNHFHCNIPDAFYTRDMATKKGAIRQRVEVFGRGMEELTLGSAEIVIDLILQKSLYRGEEFGDAVKGFQKLKKAYDKAKDKSIFLWENVTERSSGVRNSVIGTLLQDLSEGKGINESVGAFEAKVAPSNYKRTTAPVTKGMVKNAVEKINELGLEPSLHRRFAVAKDISINNVLFADRSLSPVMKDSLESMLMTQVKPASSQNFDKVEEIGIDDFLTRVLPEVSSVEVMLDGGHIRNLVSVVAPELEEPKNLFKWENPFSWSYNGNITDSGIKEKVKNAGGSVTGDLRVSLAWFNYDDLDIHLVESVGEHVYFSHKRSSKSGATLDVDMNAGGGNSREPVENITWANKGNISQGKNKVRVNNYTSRESSDVGFVIEVEFEGKITTFSYSKKIPGGKTLDAFTFEMVNGEIKFTDVHKDIESGGIAKEEWGLMTESFHKVEMIMLSPNHWDNKEVGNKHHIFVLEDCVNPDETRGIYNEFLRNDLTEHRKVFEVLADKMKCHHANDQLSGLGFSSTKRDSVICKVDGNFSRMLKINF